MSISRLILEEIHAGYGAKRILHGLSLSVEAGEVVLLIGANGAGKSTVLRVAAGLLPTIRGRVLSNGQDITRIPAFERVRSGIAYMQQGGEVFPSLDVSENLAMAMRVGDPEGRKHMLRDILDQFPSLERVARRRAGLLSGGQRQILALGMALAQRPSVLLIDEPTAGLAPEIVQRVLVAIREVATKLGLGILLVEQRVADALPVSDRAIALVHGVASGETRTPRAWLDAGALDAVFHRSTSLPDAKGATVDV